MNTSQAFALSTLLLLAPIPGQSKELRRAILIEEQERDTATAMATYRGILSDQAQTTTDRQHARLRLGRLLKRLGKHEEADPLLREVVAGKGPHAAAAAELLEQDPRRLEKAKLLEERVGQLVGSGHAGASQLKELRWMGSAIVPALTRRCATWWHNHAPQSGAYARLLWELGGEPGTQYLRGMMQERPVRRAGFLLTQVPGNIHADLRGILVELFAEIWIPAKDRAQAIRNAARALPFATLTGLCDAKEPTLAAAAFAGIQNKMDRSPANQAGRMAQLAPRLAAALDHPHPQVQRTARGLLARHGTQHTDTLHILLRDLQNYPPLENIAKHGPPSLPPTDVLLATARRIGQYSGSDQRCILVDYLLSRAFSNWSAAEQKPLFDALKLGYLRHAQVRTWLRRFVSRPEQVVELITHLGADAQALHLIRTVYFPESVYAAGLPADLWPQLKILIGADDGLTATQASQSLGLYRLIAATKAEAAGSFLFQRAQDGTDPFRRAAAIWSLASRFRWKANKTVGDQLTEVIRRINEGTSAGGRPVRDATQSACAALWALGHPSFLSLLPHLRLPEIGKSLHEPSRYSDSQRAALCTALLERLRPGSAPPPLSESHIKDLNRRLRQCIQTAEKREQLDASYAAVETFFAKYLDAVDAAPAHPLAPYREFLDWILQDHRQGHPILRKLRIRALRSPSHISFICLNVYMNGYYKPTAAELRQLLVIATSAEAPNARKAASNLSKHPPLPSDQVSSLILATPLPRLTHLCKEYISRWTGELQPPATRRLLGHSVPSIRAWALGQLHRWPHTEAVPLLLRSLNDPSPRVRKAARGILEAVHFRQTQANYWARAARKHKVDANSAAEALLAQAAPEVEKATRLLALRSLGLLAKPETLPFLIKLSQDEDPQIAKAAREAITTIHQSAKPR